jgi:hypothetical protein
MRRLALLFAVLAAVSTVENIVLSGQICKFVEAPRCVRRALISLADWRAFLIGPLRLFQRTTSRFNGPWLGPSN